MGRPAELIDGLDPVDPVTGFDKDAGVAGEGDGIARDCRDHRDARAGERPGLCLGPGAGRVEDHRVIILQFGGHERRAEQVAHWNDVHVGASFRAGQNIVVMVPSRAARASSSKPATPARTATRVQVAGR